MADVSIRNAKSGDASGVEQFLMCVEEFDGNVVRGQESQEWSWLFDQQVRAYPSAVIAESADKIVGHYGIAPMLYKVAGRDVKAGMVCKLAVQSEIRKTTAVMQMTLKLLREATADGFEFLQGLANRNGLLEFHKAFGFKNLGDVPVFAKPVRFMRPATRVLGARASWVLAPLIHLGELVFRVASWAWLGLSGAKKVTFELCEELKGDADFSASLNKFHSVFGERTTARLKHRYFSTPHRGYRFYTINEDSNVVGYFVVRVMPMQEFSSLAIVDLVFDFSQWGLAARVFAKIDQLARQAKVDLIAMLANSEALGQKLRKGFYLKTPESFQFVVYEKKPSLVKEHGGLGDWFITWYDHDYV